jgi:hypothetical protein
MIMTSSNKVTLVALRDLAAKVAAAPTADAVWAIADGAFQQLIGHKMFTVLEHIPSSREVARLYTSRPDAYQVGGRKPMGDTPWGTLVLTQGKPFLAKDADALRWAYFDHENLMSMGLETAINLPLVSAGKTLATLNLTAGPNHYTDSHLELGQVIAGLLSPALLLAHNNS